MAKINRDLQFVRTQEEISRILLRCPEARNSDLLLIWIYFKENLGLNMPPLGSTDLELIEGKMETIRRMRQHIQNDLRRFPPTKPEIMRRRRQKEEDYREWFGSHGKK